MDFRRGRRARPACVRVAGCSLLPRWKECCHSCMVYRIYHRPNCKVSDLPLKTLDDNSRGRSSSVADSSNTLLALLQSVNKRDDDTASGRTDRLSSALNAIHELTWPRETAPPRTLTFSRGRPKIFSAPMATTEKASLNSQSAMSSFETPAFFRARGTARVGAVGKSIGAQAASA